MWRTGNSYREHIYAFGHLFVRIDGTVGSGDLHLEAAEGKNGRAVRATARIPDTIPEGHGLFTITTVQQLQRWEG